MSIADDLVAGIPDLLWTQELDDYLRALGAMFSEVEDYASDPDPPPVATPFANRQNLVPNPSFEYDTLGAAPAYWSAPGIPAGATVTNYKVVSDWAAAGSRSLRVTLASVPNGGVVFPNPGASLSYFPVKPGQVIGAACVFNVVNASTRPYVWIDWYNNAKGYIGQSTAATGTRTTGVQSLKGTGTAPANAAFAVMFPILYNETGAAVTLDAYVDAVQMFDGPVPAAYWDGDTTGHYWTGVRGNSLSAPVKPVPIVGWSKMLDVDTAPAKALPYLAQWVGERLPTGLTDAAARDWIRRAPNQDRGMPAAVANAAFRWLTGTKSVFMRESAKVDGTLDSDWLAMLTYASETPNQTKVRDELRKIMPADIQLDYQTVTAVTWAAMESGSPSWATVESGSPSWRSLETNTGGFIPAGFTLWTP